MTCSGEGSTLSTLGLFKRHFRYLLPAMVVPESRTSASEGTWIQTVWKSSARGFPFKKKSLANPLKLRRSLGNQRWVGTWIQQSFVELLLGSDYTRTCRGCLLCSMRLAARAFSVYLLRSAVLARHRSAMAAAALQTAALGAERKPVQHLPTSLLHMLMEAAELPQYPDNAFLSHSASWEDSSSLCS